MRTCNINFVNKFVISGYVINAKVLFATINNYVNLFAIRIYLRNVMPGCCVNEHMITRLTVQEKHTKISCRIGLTSIQTLGKVSKKSAICLLMPNGVDRCKFKI